MIRYFSRWLLFCLVLTAGCHQAGKEAATSPADTLRHVTDSSSARAVIKKDKVATAANDTALINLSTRIVTVLKNKDFASLGSFIDANSTIRFSPYPFIDTLHDKELSAAQLLNLGKTQQKIRWGNFDGTGAPIDLSIQKYFDKFVYDADFLNAKKISTVALTGKGTPLDKLQLLYPGLYFTEFYFPGFNPSYDGMDWKSLTLLFKKESDKYFLVGIIHGQWTT